MLCARKRVLGVIATIISILLPLAGAGLAFITDNGSNALCNPVLLLYAAAAIFIIILCVCFLKSPVDADNKILYKKGNLFAQIFIDVAEAAIAFLGFDIAKADFKSLMLDNGANKELFAGFGLEQVIVIALAVVAIVLIVISYCQNTRKYKVKEVILDQKKQSPDISTLYSYEKVKRVNQLKALGVISEKNYDDAVAKFSRGA